MCENEMVDYVKYFRERLTKLIMEKGVSERKMSLQLGKTDTFIHHITSGRSLPLLVNFFEICNYLEITPAEFFEAQNQSPDTVHRISKELYKYSPETLEGLLTLIQNTEPQTLERILDIISTTNLQQK